MFDNTSVSVSDSMRTNRTHYGTVADEDSHVLGMQMHGPEMPARSGLIDFTQQMFVSDLYVRVPTMSTQYVKLDQRSQFDIVEQDHITMQTRMSSLATHIISNLCVDLGILGVVVGYQSYTIIEGFLDTNKPTWFIDNIYLIDQQVTAQQSEAIQKRLLLLLEKNLYSVIKFVCGDFELLASYTTGGDALINLKLMNFLDCAEGYTTTPLNWGAGVSNLLGTEKHLVHNAVQLSDVVSANTGRF